MADVYRQITQQLPQPDIRTNNDQRTSNADDYQPVSSAECRSTKIQSQFAIEKYQRNNSID